MWGLEICRSRTPFALPPSQPSPARVEGYQGILPRSKSLHAVLWSYPTDLTAYNNAGRVLWQKREKLAVIVGVQAVDGVLVVETTNNTVSN